MTRPKPPKRPSNPPDNPRDLGDVLPPVPEDPAWAMTPERARRRAAIPPTMAGLTVPTLDAMLDADEAENARLDALEEAERVRAEQWAERRQLDITERRLRLRRLAEAEQRRRQQQGGQSHE